MRLKAKPRNISLIQVYGPTTAATDEEMERFYQDLSQAVKQVPKGDMLLVMGDTDSHLVLDRDARRFLCNSTASCLILKLAYSKALSKSQHN